MPGNGFEELIEGIAFARADMQCAVATALQGAQVGSRHIAEIDMIAHITGRAAHDRALTTRQHIDKIGDGMLCLLPPGFPINVSIAQNDMFQSMFLLKIAHVPLSR